MLIYLGLNLRPCLQYGQVMQGTVLSTFFSSLKWSVSVAECTSLCTSMSNCGSNSLQKHEPQIIRTLLQHVNSKDDFTYGHSVQSAGQDKKQALEKHLQELLNYKVFYTNFSAV